MGPWPNTYTFTKAIAESLIRDASPDLPVAIFRPGIGKPRPRRAAPAPFSIPAPLSPVVSTYKEPLPGWIDNLYGPTGACVAAASGLLRTLHCDPDVVADIVPVDKCAAAVLAAAWDVSRGEGGARIYNYVSSVDNPVTWGEYNTINRVYGEKYPLSRSVWCNGFTMEPSYALNRFYRVVYHLLPALLVDAVLLCLWRKPRMLAMYRKIHKFSGVIEYFATREWRFTNANVKLLWEKMGSGDRELFPFRVESILWLQYFKTYLKGLREHLLKDPPETIPASRARQRRFKAVQVVLRTLLSFFFVYFLWSQLGGLVAGGEKALVFEPLA